MATFNVSSPVFHIDETDAPKVAQPNNLAKFKSWAKQFSTVNGNLYAIPSTRRKIVQLDPNGKNGFGNGFGRDGLDYVGGRIVSNPQLFRVARQAAVNWYNRATYICHGCGRDLVDVSGGRELFEKSPDAKNARFELVTLWPKGGKPGKDETVVCGDCARHRESILVACFNHKDATGKDSKYSPASFASDGHDVAEFIEQSFRLTDVAPDLGLHEGGNMNPDKFAREKFDDMGNNSYDWLIRQYARRDYDDNIARLMKFAREVDTA